jgi:hypothetical protein
VVLKEKRGRLGEGERGELDSQKLLPVAEGQRNKMETEKREQ